MGQPAYHHLEVDDDDKMFISVVVQSFVRSSVCCSINDVCLFLLCSFPSDWMMTRIFSEAGRSVVLVCVFVETQLMRYATNEKMGFLGP